MPKTIMIVDADKHLLSLVENYLNLEGYGVITACNGCEALQLARQHPPDLIVLDALLPAKMDSRTFLNAYKLERPLPILLLLALPEHSQAVIDSDISVAGCLAKPFRPRELVVRIRLAFRHAGETELTPRTLETGGILLDKCNRSVKVGALYVDLTPSEFELLAHLMSAPGCVISRADLLDVLRGARCNANQRLVDIHIKNLRAKIESDPHSPRYIETVYGFGYRFCRTTPDPLSSKL